jgi:hypothetical protein
VPGQPTGLSGCGRVGTLATRCDILPRCLAAGALSLPPMAGRVFPTTHKQVTTTMHLTNSAAPG